MIKKVLKKLNSLRILFLNGGVSYARHLGVKVGNGCRIYTTNFGSEPFFITIGNNVTITSGVKLLTHDGSTWLFRDEKGRRFLYKRILIGNNVFIGVDSIVMPGVIIEDNVIVAAGSVVTKSIPSGVTVAGNPAKIIGKFDNYKSRVLTSYKSELDAPKGVTYEERCLAMLDLNYKPYLN